MKEIKCLNKDDYRYPDSLKNLKKSSDNLYCMGNIDLLKKKSISIVGTRKPTENAQKIAQSVTAHFSNLGYVIVSGLALGIDTIAHKNARETIAILPTGLNNIVPKENQNLANKIVENGGLLITEYDISNKLKKWQYVRRNRLQSGLSLATIVIETDVNGGTMTTAKFAKKQGKLLYVYNSEAKGNLKLISKGAKSFSLPEDIKLINEQKSLDKF